MYSKKKGIPLIIFLWILCTYHNIVYTQVFTNSVLTTTDIASDPAPPVLEVVKSISPYEGYIYATMMDPVGTNNNSYLIIADNSGNIVKSKYKTTRVVDLRVHSGGQISYYDSQKMTFILADSNLEPISEIPIQNYAPDMHELLILPNENYLYIGKEDYEEDMRKYDAAGYLSATVYGKVILEYDKHGNKLFEWHTKEHLTPDESEGESLNGFIVNPFHFNSIDIDLDNNLIISARNMNQILKINRQTGEIIWRFGGKNNQFTLIGDSILFSRQHSARVQPNGNILVFDNGTNNIPPISRVCEYQLDTSTMTASLVWQFRHSPNLFSTVMGSVQRLPNNNVLIGWGSEQNTFLTEVDKNGNTMLEMKIPRGDISYRVYKFAQFPATQSGISNPHLSDPLIARVYPNPATSISKVYLTIRRRSTISYSIIDVLGRVVRYSNLGVHGEGSHTFPLTLFGLHSGVYTIEIRGDGRTNASRLVVE